MRLTIAACLVLTSALEATAQTIVYDPHPQPAPPRWTAAPGAAAPSLAWRVAPLPGSAPVPPEGWGPPGVAPVDLGGDARLLRLTGTPTVSTGRARIGDMILSAPVAFAMTARLAEPLDRWGGPLSFIKPQPVDKAMYAVPIGRKWLWCMPRSSAAIWDADCYEHFAGLYRTSTISTGRGRLSWSEGGSAVRDLTVELGPADLPPLELQYRLRKVDRRELVVELKLVGGGQEVSAGVVVLPRQGNGSATMTALGGEIALRAVGDGWEIAASRTPRADGDTPMIAFDTNPFLPGMIFGVEPS